MIECFKRFIRRKGGALFIRLQIYANTAYVDDVKKRYQIHPNVGIGAGTQIYGAGKISIGEKTYMGRNCVIQCDPASVQITIGKCCALSQNIHIRTTNYERVPNFADAFESDTRESKSIAIGDYVWIGTNAFICAGVSVGNNSIIGANSVVTKDVPADSVVGGVPARLIHYKSAYISKNRGLGLP